MGWPGCDVAEELQPKVLEKCQSDGCYPVFLDSSAANFNDQFIRGFQKPLTSSTTDSVTIFSGLSSTTFHRQWTSRKLRRRKRSFNITSRVCLPETRHFSAKPLQRIRFSRTRLSRLVRSTLSQFQQPCHIMPDHRDDQPYVWVHDYHLMLVPLLLRRRKPHLKIGWFLHTPWPSERTLEIVQNSIASL